MFRLFLISMAAALLFSCGKSKERYELSGVVVNDSTNQVLGGRKVELFYQRCSNCAEKRGEMITGADGYFHFKVKAPVRYFIKCNHQADSSFGGVSASATWIINTLSSG